MDTTGAAPRSRRILDVCRELADVIAHVDALYIGDTSGRMSSIKRELQAPLNALREEAQAEYQRETR